MLGREAKQAGRELKRAVMDTIGGDWADMEMGEGGKELEV